MSSLEQLSSLAHWAAAEAPHAVETLGPEFASASAPASVPVPTIVVLVPPQAANENPSASHPARCLNMSNLPRKMRSYLLIIPNPSSFR
jgi:hypothetical protein